MSKDRSSRSATEHSCKCVFEDSLHISHICREAAVPDIKRRCGGFLIAWILRHPAKMQAIAGTMNPEYLKDICAAAEVTLTRHEWYQLYLASGKFLP